MGRRQWERMTRERYLKAQLRDTHDDVDEAREAGSWQAVSHLRRQAMQIRAELDELAAQEAETDPLEEMDEEELLAMIEAAVGALPDSLLERLADTVEAHRTGLRVIEGGAE